MWSWHASHLLAFAICLAALLAPRASWDRVRVAVLSRLEGRAPPAPPPPAPDPTEHAELLRRTTERDDLLLEIRHVSALRASTGVRADSIIPVRARGGEAALLDAAKGGARRGARVRIDAGRAAGVLPGFAVTEGSVLVGRVSAVSDGAGEIELLTALDLAVRCRDVRSGAEGVLRGAGDGAMRFQPDLTGPDVVTGDALVTSAWSGFAPAGLLVGYVESVATDPETGGHMARARPAADLAHIDLLIVVRREHEEGGPP